MDNKQNKVWENEDRSTLTSYVFILRCTKQMEKHEAQASQDTMHGCRFVTHYAAVPSSNCAPKGKGKNMLCIAGKKKRTMQAIVTCGPRVIFALTEVNVPD